MKIRKLKPDALDAIAFLQFILLVFMAPSLSYGRSVGVKGALLILVFLTLAFVISVVLSKIIFVLVIKRRIEGRTAIWHGLFSIALAFVVSEVLMLYADYRWQVADSVITSQIEYFCFETYSHDQCVKHVLGCPQCAAQLDRWKRDKIVERLKTFRKTYPAEVAAALKSSEAKATRQPAGQPPQAD